MTAATFLGQGSAAVIAGLSAVIYALSYGALLFAGPLSAFVGYAITITLITAVIGALAGALSDGKSFIAGPDSNTITVAATTLAGVGALATTKTASPELMLQLAVATLLLTGVLCALTFYFIARANLSQLVRYIPFSVMAGLLAATGWLIASGALNIIAALSLSVAGLESFVANPLRPELAFGVIIALVLLAAPARIPTAVLIPGVIVAATAIVNLALASPWCVQACSRTAWLFAPMTALPWLAPWEINLQMVDVGFLLNTLPAMLVVAFVGLLTALLSVASLELSFQKEFDLNKILYQHAASASASAAVGGFVPILSIGRSLLNHRAGGGRMGGLIAAAMCLATLLGAGSLIAYVPKPALGGLVLFLGLGMLKQWLWTPWRTASKIEIAQILLIVGLVASFGFMVGFSAGVLIACFVFIVTYSRIPITTVATNLSLFTSSVARPDHEVKILREQGENVLLYRLRGYVFFGSAQRIDTMFRTMGENVQAVVIDFSSCSGIDSSAAGVFQRILRRYQAHKTAFYLVYGNGNERNVRMIAMAGRTDAVRYFATLDHALETAENHLIKAAGTQSQKTTALQFLDDGASRAAFLAYCEHRRVTKGDILCAEGERSNEVYFLETGTLEVLKSTSTGDVLRLAKLNAGAMVGELAFYTGEARTASIAADSDAAVYVLRRDELARLRAAHPDLATRFDHMVIQKVSHALTRANKLVALYR